MKLLSIFIALFSFLGLATAQGSQMPVVACSPTGAGVCNFGVAGLVQGNTVTWNWARIYNNNCQEIGGANGVFVNYLPIDITSSLPHVLTLGGLSYSNYNWMAFRYNGWLFNGTPHCKRTTMPGGSVIHTCQKAFNC
ncbi:hypothetical protein QBC37DRAFT_478742 [Rhypophila decipiens]|uniref:Uncharacterized protein n=1 Tax=Rhypophila decipiens TaxID=261697 RepID=A0AAN6YG01_9PEZI|nr:hypothetical protein QBC37DRAFT_478742 [Rhypophila decipiens]